MKKLLAIMLAASMAASLAACGGSGTASPSESAPASDASTSSDAASSETPSASDAASPAATESPKLEGKVLTMNLGAEPKTIDPTLNSAVEGGWVVNNTYEGLYRDKNGEFVPAIATEHTISEDGLTWTFKLRESKWSDGSPLTAKDFVTSWQRAVDPTTAAEYSYMFAAIANADEIMSATKDPSELGVTAIDDLTLEVKLAYACPYFLELVSFPTYMPVPSSVVDTDTDGLWAKSPDKGTAISNGPFSVSEYVIGSHVVLSKNANYWDVANVNLDHVICKMIVDTNTSLAAFNNGELDWNDKMPTEEISNLVAAGDAQISNSIGTGYIVINQETTIPAMQDPKVRQAISMAIDRKAICEQVRRSGEIPATGFVPRGFKDADGNDFRDVAGSYYMAETAQVDAAKALLAEAGFPDGVGFPEIEYVYNTDDKNKATAEAIQEMLKTNLGITVKLTNQEWAVFQDTRKNGNYQGMARHAWIGDYRDPQTFLDMYKTVNGKPNLQAGNRYSNPAYDEACGKGMASVGKERYDAFYEAEKIMMEDAFLIPIYFDARPIMMNERVQNWYFSITAQLWIGNADIVA